MHRNLSDEPCGHVYQFFEPDATNTKLVMAAARNTLLCEEGEAAAIVVWVTCKDYNKQSKWHRGMWSLNSFYNNMVCFVGYRLGVTKAEAKS